MGTNTLQDVVLDQNTSESMWNQYKTALCLDLVPRNSSGVPTNEAADLGSSLVRWDYLSSHFIDFDYLIRDNYSVSSSSGAFQTQSTSYVSITNLSVTVTTTGRPVIVMLIPDGSANASYVGGLSVGANTGRSIIAPYIDGSAFAESQLLVNETGASQPSYYPPGVARFAHIPAAGQHTYQVKIKAASSSSYAKVNYCKLLVYET